MSEIVSVDEGTQELFEKSCREGVKTIFDRTKLQSPRCMFGEIGFCCKLCFMGPCQVVPQKGVSNTICGANIDLIVLRNLVRHLAGGTSAHLNHSRYLIEFARLQKKLDSRKLNELKKVFDAKTSVGLFKRLSEELHLETEGILVKQFASPYLLDSWRLIGIVPKTGYFEVVEAMHKTNMGVSSSNLDLLLCSLKLGIVDGFYGLMLSTELHDLCFGSPKVVESKCNLGVLKKDFVNIVVHGSFPLVAEKLLEFSKKEEFKKLCEEAGAKGVNVVGFCCTGHEMLSRHKLELAGDFIQQEFAFATGVLDAMVVDIGCALPSLPYVAGCYHSLVFDTSPLGRLDGAIHLDFEKAPDDCARKIILMSIEAFKKRDSSKILIPSKTALVVSGFSFEELMKKGVVSKIAEAIKEKKIKGIVSLIGCNNPRVVHGKLSLELAKRLLSEGYLVFGTGCGAISLAKEGLCNLNALGICETGLKEFCETNKLPPVMLFGSCVDNSRVYKVFREISIELNKPLKELPLHVAAMEWHSEKILSIASFFLSCGLKVVSGIVPPISGSKEVTKILTDELVSITGGKVIASQDIEKIMNELKNGF